MAVAQYVTEGCVVSCALVLAASFLCSSASVDNCVYYALHELIGNADIVRFIKSRKIAWLGHVMRMDDKRTPKRILQ